MPRIPAVPANAEHAQYDERELQWISFRLRLDAIGRRPLCEGKSHQGEAAAAYRATVREVRGKAHHGHLLMAAGKKSVPQMSQNGTCAKPLPQPISGQSNLHMLREIGHLKKDCPHNTDLCARCNVKGHTVKICRHPVGFTPVQRQPRQAQTEAQAKSTPAAAKQKPKVASDKALAKWICTPCGESIRDDANEATKCPGCKAPRQSIAEVKQETGAMMQLKAQTLRTREMCKPGPLNGSIPVPQEAKDALEGTNKLQDQIASLEAMDCPADTGKTIATF